jgi:hypothetical protein
VLIIANKVSKAIQTTLLDKALKENKIPNHILKVIAKVLTLLLTRIFNLLIQLEYISCAFKKSIIVVLRKPRKDNYFKLKLYRLIVLINTLGKLLDIVLAKRIQYLVEKYYILLVIYTRE